MVERQHCQDRIARTVRTAFPAQLRLSDGQHQYLGNNVSLREHHAFWQARRAGRVDQIRQIRWGSSASFVDYIISGCPDQVCEMLHVVDATPVSNQQNTTSRNARIFRRF